MRWWCQFGTACALNHKKRLDRSVVAFSKFTSWGWETSCPQGYVVFVCYNPVLKTISKSLLRVLLFSQKHLLRGEDVIFLPRPGSVLYMYVVSAQFLFVYQYLQTPFLLLTSHFVLKWTLNKKDLENKKEKNKLSNWSH